MIRAMNMEAQHRKKDPARRHQQLLESAAMIAGRGSYRVSAQVLSPKPTRWSVPVEFTVTALNKAIQPGPKAFSPGVVR